MLATLRILALAYFLLGGWCFAQEPEQAKPAETVQDEAITALEEGARPDDPVRTLEEVNQTDSTGIEDVDRSSMYFNMIGNLLLVLGLMMLLAWLARKYLPKRFGMMAAGDGNNLRLVQSLSLGPQRFVSIVEADGKRYMLGVTEHQINLLKALDEEPFGEALSNLQEPRSVREMLEAES